VIEPEEDVEGKAGGKHCLAKVRFVILTSLAQFLSLWLPCTILLGVRAASVALSFPRAWGLAPTRAGSRFLVAYTWLLLSLSCSTLITDLKKAAMQKHLISSSPAHA